METFHQVIGHLKQVMTEIRNFIAGLESQILQGVDFATTIHSMVQSMCVSGIACRVTIDENTARAISTEQGYHLVNITREAFGNSLRHSHATQILVSLAQSAGSIRLSISDNGTGFDLDGARGAGHGLTNMAARARKIGAQLTIRSRPKHGTSIVIDLPEGTTHDIHNA
jgi:signal transduction histidine kinase